MGTGNKGLYSGTRGSSQPFAPSYGVMPDMHKSDVSRGIVQNGVYPKNPTAKDIRDMIHGNYIGNKNTNGLFTYAIDMNDNIIVGKRNGNGTGSGNDDRSGHFKPNPKSLEKAAEIFARLPKGVFHKNYIGGKSK